MESSRSRKRFVFSSQKNYIVFLKNKNISLIKKWKLQYGHRTKIIVGALLITIVIFVSYGFLSKSHADVAKFYPQSCLGGWVNPQNAQGEPDLPPASLDSLFSDNNSAVLSNSISQIYCGGFKGKLPEGVSTDNVTIHFSLAIKTSQGMSATSSEMIPGDTVPVTQTIYPPNASTTQSSSSPNQSSDNFSNESSTSSQTEVISPNPITPSEPTSTETTTKPTSWIERFFSFAFAQEVASTSLPVENTPSIITDTTNTNPLTTSPASVETLPIPAATSDASSSLSTASSSNNFDLSALTGDATSSSATSTTTVNSAESTSSQNINTSSSESSDNVLPDNIATSSENNNSSANIPSIIISTLSSSTLSSEPSSTVTDASDSSTYPPILDVSYTLDGSSWTKLGVVTWKNYKDLSFSISGLSLSDISKIQIGIQSAQVVDASFGVYLDGMWIEAEYDPSIVDKNIAPNFSASTVLDVKNFDNYYAVLLQSLADNSKSVWILQSSDNLDNWSNVTSADGVGNVSHLAVKNGNVFWVSKDNNAIIGFDVNTQSYFGGTIDYSVPDVPPVVLSDNRTAVGFSNENINFADLLTQNNIQSDDNLQGDAYFMNQYVNPSVASDNNSSSTTSTPDVINSGGNITITPSIENVSDTSTSENILTATSTTINSNTGVAPINLNATESTSTTESTLETSSTSNVSSSSPVSAPIIVEPVSSTTPVEVLSATSSDMSSPQ